MTSDQIKRIALEYGERGATNLSKELGVSKQCVFQMVSTLRRKGVIIVSRKESGIDQAMKELREEHPEMFK